MAESTPELLVVSDSHGDTITLGAVFAWGKARGISAVAFLGDGAEDPRKAFDQAAFHPVWKRVRGNGDSDHTILAQDILELGGTRIFLCHGHLHGVQDGFFSLSSAARSFKAQIALYGHTHRPFWDEYRGILMLNPGSVSRPRGDFLPSFATIGFPADGWYEPRFWTFRDGSMVKSAVREYVL